MPDPAIHVYIVDDDPSICSAFARLARTVKMKPRTFLSVEEFMCSETADANACVVCDLDFPGRSGLDLPGLLAGAGRRLPVIFVTAHDSDEARERAIRVGAAQFFHKPVNDDVLLGAIAASLGRQDPT